MFELLVALRTGEGLFTGVNSTMHIQIGSVFELFTTIKTDWLFVSVNSKIRIQVATSFRVATCQLNQIRFNDKYLQSSKCWRTNAIFTGIMLSHTVLVGIMLSPSLAHQPLGSAHLIWRLRLTSGKNWFGDLETTYARRARRKFFTLIVMYISYLIQQILCRIVNNHKLVRSINSLKKIIQCGILINCGAAINNNNNKNKTWAAWIETKFLNFHEYRQKTKTRWDTLWYQCSWCNLKHGIKGMSS